jgi:mono/diheme cytochrome c family protein
MSLFRPLALAICLLLIGIASTEGAGPPQQGAAATPDSPGGPGREIVQRKCAQCHAATMWTALRQDRRAWESTLYRMVGRGALWTPEEINAMADYLAQIRGSTSAKAAVDPPKPGESGPAK